MKDSEQQTAEQATGCVGAGDYRQYARQHGYNYCEVLNWTRSAGDWKFIVSKDGYIWNIMYQENNYPRPGFTRSIDESLEFYGTPEELFKDIEEMFG